MLTSLTHFTHSLHFNLIASSMDDGMDGMDRLVVFSSIIVIHKFSNGSLKTLT